MASGTSDVEETDFVAQETLDWVNQQQLHFSLDGRANLLAGQEVIRKKQTDQLFRRVSFADQEQRNSSCALATTKPGKASACIVNPCKYAPSSKSILRKSSHQSFSIIYPIDAMDKMKRPSKPRMLLMGQRRSGKSSITSVVFHKMEPQETLFLESTTRIQKDTMNSFMDFQVWDFPGQLDYFDPTFDTTQIFSDIGALIWVVDAQDDYTDSLARLTTTIINLQNTFPHINVEVFVHKTDSLNEDLRSDIFQDIVQRVGDDLNDAGFINPNVSYHLTSIYDSSIFEALSSVIQKLIPELDVLQNLLNTLINNSGMTKAYLFDILSKIYVASDSRPVDSDMYEICANYIDLTVDFTDLYNYHRENANKLGEQMEEVESSMTFEDGTMVYLKEMNKHLCLVTVIKNREARDKKGMIDYNVHIFQEALKAVFERGWEKKKLHGDGSASSTDGLAQDGSADGEVSQ